MATDLSNPINPSNLFAAVDMGTNSFKMILVRADPNGRFLSIDRHKAPVVLGRGMYPNSPTITLESQNRAISALHKFKHLLDYHQVQHTKFVATSAVREAVNKGEFLANIEEQTSLKVQVLSGEEEARLVYLGVLQFLPVYDKNVLTIDIGGGSTEFVIGRKGEVVFAVSLKLGHVSLTEAFGKNGDVSGMRQHIRGVIQESGLVEKVKEIGFEIAVGSSGTIRSVERAVFLGYAEDLMSASVWNDEFKRKWRFGRNELSHVVERLCGSYGKEEENVRRSSFFKRRSEFILAGAVLLSEIFGVLNIDEMEVSEFALGEGVITEALTRCYEDYDVNANARWRSVVRFATRFHSDKRMKSATHCAGIARELFAGLRKYDELANQPTMYVLTLDEKDLEYLEAACLLHNIGLFIGKKGYQKQSYHIIKNGDYLNGYNAKEVELIALLAKHHRKKFPKSGHSSLQTFTDKEKERFRILCAVIRISCAIQQSLCIEFQGLETSNNPEGFELILRASKDGTLLPGQLQLTVEDVEAELKLELDHFEQVFKKKLSVVISSS